MREVEKLIELSKVKCEIDIKRGEKKYFDFEWLLMRFQAKY